MITGGRIDSIAGKKTSEDQIKGLNINIAIDTVKINGQKIEVGYTYIASYPDNVGEMTIKGVLFADEDKKISKEVEIEWQKNKKIPQVYAETILNAINYTGSANGTLIARVLNLSPPLVPPRISLSEAAKK
ncbi:MAG: hypothetical protein Q7S22_00515 [Candidatus Micrarchaeota archaeon]|nr:hypothetical protein [Candidatus Micrarchaeota archaeon]